ncbi:SpoIIE family protein phosphatase [Jannaschia sp. R86511]|uniref:SpoIIE family protein phosphatase n=1 Tax=Jannaschia sp. R86511 TaxID=3093853 RepID=UPI0036D405DF
MQEQQTPGPPLDDFLTGVDWAATPLGPAAGWGPELRWTVALASATRYPVALFWGPDLVMVYNRAYTDLIGDKHPAALGRPAQDVFPEIWDLVGPMFQRVADTGEPTWSQDERMFLHRHGFAEECFFTFSYSAVRDDHGRVLGVVDIAAETTAQVVDRRRLELLARLGHALVGLDDPADLGALVLPLLRRFPLDLPAVELVGPGRGTEPDRDHRLALSPPAGSQDTGSGLTTTATADGTVAWLPVRGDGDLGNALLVLLSEHQPLDGAYRQFLRLMADAVGAAESRARVRVAEREAVAVTRRMSEQLQRAMLTDLPVAERLTVHARYEPAVHTEQIGGDWYDAIVLPDSSTVLVVGDVAGHDSAAAGAMGQLRATTRALAWALRDTPAGLLGRVDEAAAGLGVQSLATSLVARLDAPAADGARRLRWSSAGHLPPLLAVPDGGARLLEGTTDLMLGVQAGATRRDNEATVPPGSTLLLVTDGLVERRHRPIDTGLALLRAAATAHAGRPLRDMVDAVVHDLTDHGSAEQARHVDDVVVLGARGT